VSVRASLLVRLRRLFRLAAAPAWAGPTVVGLGLAAAVLEGAGLFLFIPLLQSLGASPPQPGRWQPIFDQLLAPVPEHLLTAFLVGALCVSIILKNAVHLVNTWVTRYVDGLVAHQLRSRVFDQTISSCVDYRVENKRSDIITTIANNTWKVSQGLSLAYRLCPVDALDLRSIDLFLDDVSVLRCYGHSFGYTPRRRDRQGRG
jgi:subfamily B ATP-binding cassette protein MsbA